MHRTRVAGFTLIEVIVSISILAAVSLTVGAATGNLVKQGAIDRVSIQAAAAAEARLAEVQVWPEYNTIDSAFAGTSANTPFTGWTRVTTVARTGGLNAANDYKKITVSITGPGLAAAVTRSITIANTI